MKNRFQKLCEEDPEESTCTRGIVARNVKWSQIQQVTPPPGYFHQNRTWMCLPDLENLYFLSTNFLPNIPPISLPFSKEKLPILTKLDAFYNNFPKIHPIYVIWAPSSLLKTPRSLYQISRKSAPKGRHIYVYHVNVRPPGSKTRPTVIKKKPY